MLAPGWALFGLALFWKSDFSAKKVSQLGACKVISRWPPPFWRLYLVNIDLPRHELLVTSVPLALVFYYGVIGGLEFRERDSLSGSRQSAARRSGHRLPGHGDLRHNCL